MPVPIPKGVTVTMQGSVLGAKGSKGSGELVLHPTVAVEETEGELRFKARSESATDRAIAGTMRALASNLVRGVHEGFERKLTLVGVGYRAQAQGKVLNLTLGLSHPVAHQIPDGITVETPSQTEIVVRGTDCQRVGQVAADIRRYRPPEPYKGKGIRYADEKLSLKEAKKK
jgi:large subunit ribosomal protein L6